MKELNNQLTPFTQFTYKNETFTCREAKIIGKAVKKLVITTTKKTIVLFLQEEVDDVLVLGKKTPTSSFNSLMKDVNILKKVEVKEQKKIVVPIANEEQLTELEKAILRLNSYAIPTDNVDTLDEYKDLPLKRPFSKEEDNLFFSTNVPVRLLAKLTNRFVHDINNRKKRFIQFGKEPSKLTT